MQEESIGPFHLPELVSGAAAWSHFYNKEETLSTDVPLRTIRLALRYVDYATLHARDPPHIPSRPQGTVSAPSTLRHTTTTLRSYSAQPSKLSNTNSHDRPTNSSPKSGDTVAARSTTRQARYARVSAAPSAACTRNIWTWYICTMSSS